jgi:hypothetical protein
MIILEASDILSDDQYCALILYHKFLLAMVWQITLAEDKGWTY